jgi:hypothetical protein
MDRAAGDSTTPRAKVNVIRRVLAAESFNVLGRVELEVTYGAGREDDADVERAWREWVARREAAHPCYQVSWDGEAIIDGHTAVRRLFRGFTDLNTAGAFLESDPGDDCRLIDPGDDCRLIDRRTGESALLPRW